MPAYQLSVIHDPLGKPPAGAGLPPFGVRRQPDTGPGVISGDWPLALAYRWVRTWRRFGWGPAANQCAVAALRVERRTADSRHTPRQ